MKTSEFRKQLAALGARFAEGAKHTKVYLNDKQTTLPRHGSQEIGEGLRRAILRQGREAKGQMTSVVSQRPS